MNSRRLMLLTQAQEWSSHHIPQDLKPIGQWGGRPIGLSLDRFRRHIGHLVGFGPWPRNVRYSPHRDRTPVVGVHVG